MLGLYGGATGLVIELAARKAIEAFSKKSTDSAHVSIPHNRAIHI